MVDVYNPPQGGGGASIAEYADDEFPSGLAMHSLGFDTTNHRLMFYNSNLDLWFSVEEFTLSFSLGNVSPYTGARDMNWSGTVPSLTEGGPRFSGPIRVMRFVASSAEDILTPDNVGVRFYKNFSGGTMVAAASLIEWTGASKKLSAALNIDYDDGNTFHCRYEVGIGTPIHAGKSIVIIFCRHRIIPA